MRRPRRLIVVSNMSSPGRGILAGISEYCRKHGQWQFQFEPNPAERVSLERVKRSLALWNPDGILAHIDDDHWDKLIAESGLPAVNLANKPSAYGTPLVGVDYLAVGQMVGQYFLDKGLKNFAYCGFSDTAESDYRREGFRQRVQDAGFTCSVLEGCTSRHRSQWVEARHMIERWLVMLPKPVGILCCHDKRGQEVTEACREVGLTVPDEVSVVGVANDELVCTLSDPPISSVEIPSRRIGYEAAALIHQMINGRRATRKHISLSPMDIIVRASSEKAAISDPDIVGALQFIAENAESPITVKSILGEVAMSRRSLERRCWEATGRTQRQQILHAHIAQAKRLLVNADIAIPKVAAQSGFIRPDVFSRVFRRQMGIAPSAYRKRFRVN
jgi:LacI family transcriptional regulator